MNEETIIQTTFIHWLRCNHPDLLFTIAPSGMKLPIGVAVRMKKMGYSAGTPDVMIFRPSGDYHGLFIELKTERGKLSPEQKEWSSRLNAMNYKSVVCRSVADAIMEVLKYLK